MQKDFFEHLWNAVVAHSDKNDATCSARSAANALVALGHCDALVSALNHIQRGIDNIEPSRAIDPHLQETIMSALDEEAFWEYPEIDRVVGQERTISFRIHRQTGKKAVKNYSRRSVQSVA